MLNDTAMALDRFVLLEHVSVIASFDNNPIYNHRVLGQREDWGESRLRAVRGATGKKKKCGWHLLCEGESTQSSLSCFHYLIAATQERATQALLCVPHLWGRARSWHSHVWGAELIRGWPRTRNCDLPGLLVPLRARPSLPLMCFSILLQLLSSDRCLYWDNTCWLQFTGLLCACRFCAVRKHFHLLPVSSRDFHCF